MNCSTRYIFYKWIWEMEEIRKEQPGLSPAYVCDFVQWGRETAC